MSASTRTCVPTRRSRQAYLLLVLTRVVIVPIVTGAAVLGFSCGSGTAVIEGGKQRGFALIWDPGYRGPQLAQSLREMVDVGGTSVQFTPTWGQETTTSSVIGRTPRTVGDAELERVIAMAHAAGLKVFLKPHIELPNPEVESRSTIRPDKREAWFDSYTAFITHYAAMAQRMAVEQFAVGSELSSISDDRPGWLRVIQEVRTQYTGTVVYSADPREYPLVPFWDALDLIGVDAYFPLTQGPTTDVAELQRSWEPIRAELAAFAASHRRNILFTEAGYTSRAGSTASPASWTLETPPDQTEQAAAYQALLATFTGQAWWDGVYWWVWNNLPDNGSDHSTNFSPRGKAAEQVIREWWPR